MKRIGAAPAPNTLARSDGWRDHAACDGRDKDLFFPEGGHREVRAQADAAKAICARCPVTAECLAYALDPFERRRHTATPKRPHTGGRLRAPCGTPAAYERHKRYGEDIDDACMNNRSRTRRTTEEAAA